MITVITLVNTFRTLQNYHFVCVVTALTIYWFSKEPTIGVGRAGRRGRSVGEMCGALRCPLGGFTVKDPRGSWVGLLMESVNCW